MSLKLMNLWLVYKLIKGKLISHVFPQTAEVIDLEVNGELGTVLGN